MTPSAVSTIEWNGFGGSTFDLNITVANVGDIVVLMVMGNESAPDTNLSATLDGAAMTLRDFAVVGSSSVSCYEAVAAATGLRTITLTKVSGTPTGRMSAYCLPGATYNSPTAKAASEFPSSPSTLTRALPSNGILIDGFTANDSIDANSLTPGAGQTANGNVTFGTKVLGSSWKEGADMSWSWTGFTINRAHLVVAYAGAAAPATVTGSVTLADIDVSGSLGLNPAQLGASTLTIDNIAPTGTLGIAPGSVSTNPFTRNTGSLPTGLTAVAVAILSDDATLTRLAGATSLNQDGSGRITYTGAGLPAVGTSVLILTRESDGKLGVERYTVQ